MSNPTTPALPVNALIAQGDEIELRSLIRFLNPLHKAQYLAYLGDLEDVAFTSANVVMSAEGTYWAVDDTLDVALTALVGALAGKASTGYVDAAVAALVNSSPAALDTLKELATALGDDANFAATMTTALAGKVPTTRSIGASGLLSGGGDLSANRTFTVTAASQAEAEAGTATTVAMTPQRTRQAIAALAGGGGFVGEGGLTKMVAYSPEVPAQPATIYLEIAAMNFSENWTVLVNGVTNIDVYFYDGSGWDVDTSTSIEQITTDVIAFINANYSSDVVATANGAGFNIDTVVTGAGASLASSYTGNITNSSTSDTGVDLIPEIPASGDNEVELVAAQAGKRFVLSQLIITQPETVGWGNGVVSIGYDDGATYYEFLTIPYTSLGAGGYVVLDSSNVTIYEPVYFSTPPLGAALIAKTTTDESSGDPIYIRVLGIVK